jgi:IS30 family transposase
MEGFLKADKSAVWISRQLSRNPSTIYREIKRGLVKHIRSDLTTAMMYNADRAQDVQNKNVSAKGPMVKLRTNSPAFEFIHYYIASNKWSPEAIAAEMKKKNIQGAVCAKSIYTYIDRGEIKGVSNESLWEKRMRGKKHKSLHRKAKRGVPLGHSIEERPEKINDRTEYGAWEIDLVVSGRHKGKAALLTLTERKTRKEIIRKLKNGTQECVVRAINSIERAMGRKAFKTEFKSITADNGAEFLDFKALEKSVFGSFSRTHIYYAHPYASWERGSNENANRMIRRFIPKGCDISKFSISNIKKIEKWINQYPRKILKFKTPEEMSILEMAS